MKKIFVTLLCLFLLLTAAACTQDPEKSYEEQKSLYDGIIEEYTALLTAKQNGEELPAPDTEGMDEREAAITDALYLVVTACESPENMAYTYKDMDSNGTPELLLLTYPYVTPSLPSLRAIFSLDKKSPVLLACAGEEEDWYFDTKGQVFVTTYTVLDEEKKQCEATNAHFYVKDAKLVQDTLYGLSWIIKNNRHESYQYFELIDGQRQPVDEERYHILSSDFDEAIEYAETLEQKLNSPRIFYPLTEQTESPPAADFSTYAAIRETYKAISSCIEDYDDSKWYAGKYDHLFSYPDEQSFNIYNRLLYTAYNGAYDEGYDEIDLNGDGQNELVIMNEDYTIKAIFTQKKNKPVMLGAFPNASCWLDDQGLIHVDRIDYYELEYSLYEFTKDGNFNLIYSLLLAENGNRYLTKDGKTEKISFEESLEIYYDDYCRYTEPFEAHEYTRSVSDLTYTPLFEMTDDFRKAATEKTWQKHASLDKTSGKEWGAWSNTYVTFENVTDTQMDVNFKYVFTFSYPDPDRENYLLNDSTESNLKLTASNRDGVWVFEGEGVKGHLEFSHKYLWIIIDESTDERFPTGFHCYGHSESES